VCIYTYTSMLYKYINSRVIECSFLCKNLIIKRIYCTTWQKSESKTEYIYIKGRVCDVHGYHRCSNRIHESRFDDINRLYFPRYIFSMMILSILFTYHIYSIKKRMLKQVRKLIISSLHRAFVCIYSIIDCSRWKRRYLLLPYAYIYVMRKLERCSFIDMNST